MSSIAYTYSFYMHFMQYGVSVHVKAHMNEYWELA